MEVSVPLIDKKLLWFSGYISTFDQLSVGGFLFILPLCICFTGTQPTAWRSPCPWRWQRTTRTSATTPRCGSLRRLNWAKAKRSRARELRILSSQERSRRLFGIRYLTILNLLKSGLDQHSREECKWMQSLHGDLKWSFKQDTLMVIMTTRGSIALNVRDSTCHHRVCSDYFAPCSVANM